MLKQIRTGLIVCSMAVTVLLTGCGGQSVKPAVVDKTSVAEKPVVSWRYNNVTPLPAAEATVQEQLLRQFAEWEGVPYRLGGTTKKGIDCSAFVQRSFAAQFDLNLPRTTLKQAVIGTPVSRDELRPGDLVFFKTGTYSRHVGIYIGNQSFLHSGETLGVSITPLANPYWRKRFWQARRPGIVQTSESQSLADR
ncbi:NlpC/P60 family protein [Aliamphritea spongicola]|uniref:NlpC/P60 family protein n=1 Tax=Aliamphritea spongicola TaxID=707589 RepID=UPI001FAF5625|nr:NlpC/P60 family protein [Aliamphritea spongicola]